MMRTNSGELLAVVELLGVVLLDGRHVEAAAEGHHKCERQHCAVGSTSVTGFQEALRRHGTVGTDLVRSKPLPKAATDASTSTARWDRHP